MSPQTEEVLRSALTLAPGEQVELIEALLADLERHDPQPLDAAWQAEIQRRSADYDAGRSTPVPWSEVRARVRGQADDHG